jgi:hypothetical protein
MSYATKELIITPKMDCDQTAMGLPPVTSAVFLIAKSFWYEGVSEYLIWFSYPFENIERTYTDTEENKIWSKSTFLIGKVCIKTLRKKIKCGLSRLS